MSHNDAFPTATYSQLRRMAMLKVDFGTEVFPHGLAADSPGLS